MLGKFFFFLDLPRLRMMRTMTKRMMKEEMMSNPIRMKVTIKMATNTLGLIFKHVHKLCDQGPLQACS
jgi:hypothetical protein